ncbi:ABC transporter G family member 20-like [Brevipalpus obovatus]|uniref:ABC transporter G family member 20-like n=1 Tax=Brevipalpus obovatus TaxID=246614 RepID=UPI003D9F27A5
MNLVVDVNRISFSFPGSKDDDTIIIRNVSIQTYSSQILAIVGPSGCGKTTLIKLIVSLLPVDGGKIALFGHDCTNSPKNREIVGVPGPNLGFMPQEDALTDDLTVHECLYMYGILNRMEPSSINRRIREVLTDLDLIDSEKSYIFNLSGGMKRRVSLGIAILHSPQLLVLDEPTVGVDPILRHRIWQLMENMKNNEASILITTHYIEECGHADIMCFMRNGQILKAESPRTISAQNGFVSFEKVFLDLCSMSVENIESSGNLVNSATILNPSPESFVPPKPYNTSHWINVRIFLILMYRYFHLFVFTPASFFCILGVPTFNVYTTYLTISDDLTHVSIGLCIQNQSLYHDTALLKRLNIRPACLECIHPDHFPEFINQRVFHVIRYDNIDTAIEDLSRFKIHAAIHIREGFADALFRKLVLDWSELDIKLIRDSQIKLYCDASNANIFRVVEGHLSDAYAKYWEASKGNLSLKQLSTYPMKFENSVIDGKKFEEHSSRSWFLLGGMTIAITSATIMTAGSAIIREVKDQSIQRYMSTGLSVMQIFLVQLLSNTIFLAISGILSLVTTLLLLGVECRGSPVIAALLIVGMILNCVLIGQLIGLSQLSEVLVLILGLSSSYVTASIEGAYISMESFPYFVEYVFKLFPNTYPMRAMRDTVLVGISPDNPKVLIGFFTLFFYFVLLFTTSFRLTSVRIGQIRSKSGVK